MERTLVILKPDAVSRGLTGRIIQIFEDAGFDIVALKMLVAENSIMDVHYPTDQDWVENLGRRTVDGFRELGMDPIKEVGSDNLYEVGLQVRKWLVDFMSSGPVVAMVLEGNLAAKNVRRMVGHTVPSLSEPGTIRGRFSVDSAERANLEKRPILNLIHASGDPEEAAREIKLWFPELN